VRGAARHGLPLQVGGEATPLSLLAAAAEGMGRSGRCGSKIFAVDGRKRWRSGGRWRTATVLGGDRAVYVSDVPVRRLRSVAVERWSRDPEQTESRDHYQAAR
jgi:hypothetical protein